MTEKKEDPSFCVPIMMGASGKVTMLVGLSDEDLGKLEAGEPIIASGQAGFASPVVCRVSHIPEHIIALMREAQAKVDELNAKLSAEETKPTAPGGEA